ncbi:MAG TPA: CRTAC1 family protein [Planctomycetes bacterium]|nr:CRTAC1 family protein [Fuerstiella sp.]HIK93829.1 CRTAC1 family protein [Planctomycetota bacterium]
MITYRRFQLFLSAGILLIACVSVTWLMRSQPVVDTGPSGELSLADERSVEATLLTDISASAMLDFVHTPGDLQNYFFPSIMGGGCALFDYDLDGRLDIYFVNGNDFQGAIVTDEAESVAVNRLYRQTAEGTFVDVTDQSHTADSGFGMGVAVGDVNNDGFPDLYVTNYGPDRLYLNQQNGTFIDVTEAAGLDNVHWSASASFVDFDRDGWLDLYVTNYVDYYVERNCPDAIGRLEFCGPQTFFPVADKLFRNVTGTFVSDVSPGDPSGIRFRDASLSSGISGQAAAGLGVVCADFNHDHWPDIYVANDRMANFLWINQQDDTFVDEAVLRGVAFDSQGRSQAGMGIAVADLNGDSVTDLFITHIEGESNALYLSREGVFREESAQAGLLTTSFPFTGFGSAFVDISHNTYPDIVVVNGRVKRGQTGQQDPGRAWQQYAERNLIFLNTGAGEFTQSGLGNPFCTLAGISRGLATGDIDNDGDVDFLVTNIGSSATLFRNDAIKSGGWLKVRVVDPSLGGRDAYGAEVTVIAGRNRWSKTIQSGTGYLSASEPIAHFGMGSAERYDRIDVIWPDGLAEFFDGGPCAVTRRVERGTGKELDGPSRKQ